MHFACSLRRQQSGHLAHLHFAGAMFWLTWKRLSGSLGRPLRSLVGALIAPPRGRAQPTTGGHPSEGSNLDFEVRNLDFPAGGRIATLKS